MKEYEHVRMDSIKTSLTDQDLDPQTYSSRHSHGQQELSTRSGFHIHPGCGTDRWNELVPATIGCTGAIHAHTLRWRLTLLSDLH